MTLIEAAEVILLKAKGSCLSAREITDMAMKHGLIKPKSAKPWMHLHAALKQHNQQSINAGQKERFSFAGGKWKLH